MALTGLASTLDGTTILAVSTRDSNSGTFVDLKDISISDSKSYIGALRKCANDLKSNIKHYNWELTALYGVFQDKVKPGAPDTIPTDDDALKMIGLFKNYQAFGEKVKEHHVQLKTARRKEIKDFKTVADLMKAPGASFDIEFIRDSRKKLVGAKRRHGDVKLRIQSLRQFTEASRQEINNFNFNLEDDYDDQEEQSDAALLRFTV